MHSKEMGRTDSKDALTENYDKEADRIHVARARWVLLKGAVVDKVVVVEEFDLLARLLQHDVFNCERMDAECLCEHSNLCVCRRHHI